MQANIETTFVNTFIKRAFRERWSTRLASSKTRSKQLNRLAHTLIDDLDRRYVYANDALPPPIATQVQSTLIMWKRTQRAQACYVIVCSSQRDGQMMPLSEIQTDYQLTFGAIIILSPDTLAYYYTERSNLTKQPVYVLFQEPLQYED